MFLALPARLKICSFYRFPSAHIFGDFGRPEPTNLGIGVDVTLRCILSLYLGHMQATCSLPDHFSERKRSRQRNNASPAPRLDHTRRHDLGRARLAGSEPAQLVHEAQRYQVRLLALEPHASVLFLFDKIHDHVERTSEYSHDLERVL